MLRGEVCGRAAGGRGSGGEGDGRRAEGGGQCVEAEAEAEAEAKGKVEAIIRQWVVIVR